MANSITEQMVLRGDVTALAIELEIAMRCDDAARARYREIYCKEWVSTLDPAEYGYSVIPADANTTAATKVL